MYSFRRIRVNESRISQSRFHLSTENHLPTQAVTMVWAPVRCRSTAKRLVAPGDFCSPGRGPEHGRLLSCTGTDFTLLSGNICFHSFFAARLSHFLSR